MRTTVILGVAVLATVAGARGLAQAGAQSASSGDPAIKQVADAYVKASLAGDAKAIAALYTEDAVEMPPNQPPIKGRAAIEQHYATLLAGTKLGTFTLTHLESRASGDMGYDAGTYDQSVTPGGATAPMKDTGKYVVILKRTGGAWKVAYAIYNSNQPPPPR
jgi:uncharacterized protein (TIGR02246 family)